VSETILVVTSKNLSELDRLLSEVKTLIACGAHLRFLLFGEAAYSATRDSIGSAIVHDLTPSVEFFVTKQDLKIRGLEAQLERTVRALEYDEIVDLIMTNNDKIISYV
jgi:sulfur relay protein TusB/DsrH